MRILAAVTLGAALLLARGAHAWGEDGHSIIAEIAQRRLSAAAGNMVVELLGPGHALASVASWADDVRGARPETYNWHFVDIPRAADDYSESRDCPESPKGDCIVKALARLKDTLACSTDVAARRDALRFAVHFVGDIHQPLHAIGDALGGNKVGVRGEIRGATCTSLCGLGSLDSRNLHMLWDTTLIRRSYYDWGAYVDHLEQGWLATEAFQIGADGETPVDWALQSHALANLVWNDTLVPGDGALDDRYYTAVQPILDQQLALAGVRLARFLNDAAAAECGGSAVPATAERGLRRHANIGDAKNQAKAYLSSPADGDPSSYERDQAVGGAAIAYLKQRAGSVARPAIVLDIDETLERAVAVPTLQLFQAARQLGVTVFFITRRHENERQVTEENLAKAGYRGYQRVFMEKVAATYPSVADFKAPIRAGIVMQGYTIIENVGYQPSDLAGGYAEKAFLMPNPYHRIPGSP